MKLTKENLEALYETMSLTELAEYLHMAKSTLYYHMKKLGVERRSKQEAQKRHLEQGSHQRLGTKHSLESRIKISQGTQKFWDSNDGDEQKAKLAKLRQEEWQDRSKLQKKMVLHRLQNASRPSPGELSRFGTKLYEFLSEHFDVSAGIRLISSHVSDIILPNEKVVIELVLPIDVYGEEQAQRLKRRYDKIVAELHTLGYRVIIIEDKSNSVSYARCQRIHERLLSFLKESNSKVLRIVS